MRSLFLRSAVAIAVLFLAMPAHADDNFYRVKIGDLHFTDGALPKHAPGIPMWRVWQRMPSKSPYAVVDGGGEVYVRAGNQLLPNGPFARVDSRHPENQDSIFIRASNPGDVTGRLFWPKPDGSAMITLKFTIPANSADAELKDAFYQAKEDHYRDFFERELPGAAWFRHEMRDAQAAQSKKPAEVDGNRRPSLGRWNGGFTGDGRLIETYSLFTGGRAVSENLQLDRTLQGTTPEKSTVDIDTIQGITIDEIDWKPLIKDEKPALDPLAASIPADQHVVFFPTFSAAVATADQAEIQGTPILHMAEPRSEDARTADRYQRQLCLSLTGLGRLLGPKVAKSVALTGSDLNFRTGTDIAVLFQTDNPILLEALLTTQIAAASAKTPGIKSEQGQIDGLAYRGVRSPDRTACSYVARLKNAVVVTNSLYQIERLAAVANQKSPSIASLPEYTFFRNRYKLGDPDETAFVFLSDATIRRWCGPKWRIATSRQLRDLAVITELQASNLDRLVKGAAQPGPIYSDFTTSNIGELSLDHSGVHSSVQGSLEFMTPIAEMPLKKVTKAEADAYRWWRDTYQNNWRWAFDPIAMRVTLKQTRLAADLTVMPLIFGTEYRELAALSQGATIAPDAGDRHDALLHFIVAINTKSSMFTRTENFISAMSQGVTLGWLGSSVSLFVDDDPYWAELAKTPREEFEHNFAKFLANLPLAIRAEVNSGLRLTAFLASARAYLEQTAPGMTAWQSLKYKDQSYVKITPSEKAKGITKDAELAIYYVATGDALLVTLNENVLKHAIDRQLAREAAKKDATAPTVPASKPWLGQNVGLQVTREATDIFGAVRQDENQLEMQTRAWSNLPILNEWKRLYPDKDPVELHERVWKIRLTCPGGGRYVWNDKYQTMESTVYGCPAEPKIGPVMSAALAGFDDANFGLTFENQGLRARVSLERKPHDSKDKP